MTWDDLAAGWERWAELRSETSAPVDRWFLDALDPRPGQTVLDIGAGTGDAGFLIADRLGPSGAVLVADLSEAMVDGARRRARQLGYGNVDAVVMDALDLDLADGVVDAVLCRWTLYLLPDPALALREMARVVRPGGRVAIGVWAEAERNPLVPMLVRELVARGHMEPPPAETHTLDLVPMLTDAGLAGARVEEVPFAWTFASPAEAAQYVADAGGEAGRILSTLDTPGRVEVRDAYAAALDAAGYVGADGRVAVPAVALNALAVRPA